MKTKRMFLAINLPAELKRYISVMQEEYKKHISHVKWVEEENFHLTLKFFGEVPINSVEEITDAIRKGVGKTKPFDISIKNVGVFPKISQAKVIWLGVDEGKNKVIDLFNAIDLALEEVGFKKESKVYKPHLTIGRCREPQYVDINKFKFDFGGRCIVGNVDLMMSQLTPRGPIYTLVESVSLVK